MWYYSTTWSEISFYVCWFITSIKDQILHFWTKDCSLIVPLTNIFFLYSDRKRYCPCRWRGFLSSYWYSYCPITYCFINITLIAYSQTIKQIKKKLAFIARCCVLNLLHDRAEAQAGATRWRKIFQAAEVTSDKLLRRLTQTLYVSDCKWYYILVLFYDEAKASENVRTNFQTTY